MDILQLSLTFGALAFLAAMILHVSGLAYAEHVVGIAFHLGMLPAVASLPCNPVGMAAGYFWVFMDTLIGGASINGLDEKTAWALRMGVHLAAGFWIVSAALQQATLQMVVGLLAGITLAGFSLLSPFVPQKAIAINMPFMLAWFLMTAWL